MRREKRKKIIKNIVINIIFKLFICRRDKRCGKFGGYIIYCFVYFEAYKRLYCGKV